MKRPKDGINWAQAADRARPFFPPKMLIWDHGHIHIVRHDGAAATRYEKLDVSTRPNMRLIKPTEACYSRLLTTCCRLITVAWRQRSAEER